MNSANVIIFLYLLVMFIILLISLIKNRRSYVDLKPLKKLKVKDFPDTEGDLFIFKKFDDHLNVGIFKRLVGDRILFKSIDGRAHMQMDKERFFACLEYYSCWRCYDLNEVCAPQSKQYFDCPACSWRK